MPVVVYMSFRFSHLLFLGGGWVVDVKVNWLLTDILDMMVLSTSALCVFVESFLAPPFEFAHLLLRFLHSFGTVFVALSPKICRAQPMGVVKEFSA